MGKPELKPRHAKTLDQDIRGVSLKRKRTAPVPTNVIERAALHNEGLDDIIKLDPQKLEKLQTQLARDQVGNKTLKINKQATANMFVAESDDELVDLFDEVAPLTINDEQILQALKSASPQDLLTTLKPVYSQLAPILKQYRSGILPKLLKWVPSSKLWFQILEMTNFECWSPQAMYGLTRLFIASLPEDQSYIYISHILVPACQQDLKQTQKLNIHYFNALIKSKYRCFAFFRGVVFFAVEHSQSSAFVKVVNAAVQKCSFPRTAIIPAFIQLIQMEPNPALYAVLASLITKNYSLPEGLLNDILGFYEKTSNMNQTLVWHDGLLRFSRIYAGVLNGEQQVRLYQTAKRCFHEGGISDEILRVVKFAGNKAGQEQSGRVGAADIVI
ncbi:Bystin [Hexamita inflata]|uniref:Bystin n=1 Tax=Hexamita inflata TaxID=28002 RepID=A0AA86NFI8_9EUKA|nr:Bystin [Hexamita inflata]CAI9940067.1 Bystin [Hexamita inflata]CAI9946911.1 Bystin [Hexamita inflata]